MVMVLTDRIKGRKAMSLEGNVSDHQKSKIREFIKEGSNLKQQVADINESLKDLAKTIGEDIGVKPALLTKALNIAFKNNAEEENEKNSTVEEILAIAGII